jgi:hypothetical protein
LQHVALARRQRHNWAETSPADAVSAVASRQHLGKIVDIDEIRLPRRRSASISLLRAIANVMGQTGR